MELNILIPGKFDYIDLVQVKKNDGALKNEWKLKYEVNSEAKEIGERLQYYMLKAEEDLLSPCLDNGEVFPSKVDFKIGPYWIH